MITEDYISFEIAKLLKEKGFEGYSIITTYDENAANAYAKELLEKHLPYSSDDPKLKEFYYTIPTLQMAMKWLREVHKISIEITSTGYLIDNDATWECDIKAGHRLYFKHITNEKSFESCAETAIKYCLKNLI